MSGEETSDDEIGGIADAFAKAKEFLEVTSFKFGEASAFASNSPTRKSSLASWTNYYRSLMMKPGQIVQQLYPTISQCETLDAEVLKRDKPQLIRQLNALKTQFETQFQTLIEELSSIPQEVLLRGIPGDPTAHQTRKVDLYYTELQAEITAKITRLTDIHSDIATRYALIMIKVDYVNVTPLVTRPSQSIGVPQPKTKYQPNPTFLEHGGNKDRTKPWYTTASDLMSESNVTIISEWLHSGGHYTSYTDPTRFLKLLLDEETGRVLSSRLKERVTPDNQYLSVEQIMDSLEALVASRKTLNTRRMDFFSSYNTPRLMGVKGCNVDIVGKAGQRRSGVQVRNIQLERLPNPIVHQYADQ